MIQDLGSEVVCQLCISNHPLPPIEKGLLVRYTNLCFRFLLCNIN